MTTEKRVTVVEDRVIALQELETRFAMATRQRELLENYIKERLKPDKHFYTVGDEPGRKPSLTKEGAELICLPHALKGHYHWLSGPETPPLDDTPYQITMNCELEANGKFAGEGIGSASSMITRKSGERVQRQKDPGLRHNATIKMACKSAYIAATLNSTAASEFFTQDLEDDQTGDSIKSEKQDTSKHWCKEHNTTFFMKGKMKAFAHPIGDTGEWCHEHIEDKPIAKVEPQPPSGALESKTEPPKAEEGNQPPEKVATKSKKEKPSGKIGKIDREWLLESIGKLRWDILKYIKETYSVTLAGKETLFDVVGKLTEEQQAALVKEIEDRLQML